MFNGTDFWSILKKTWPDPEQGMLAWRRKTRELFDTIKKSKACWYPMLNKMLELTPDLTLHSTLSPSQWSSLEHLVDTARSNNQKCALPPPSAAADDEDAATAATEMVDEKEEPTKSVILPWLSSSVKQLHQIAALFHRVVESHLPVYVRRGGRGAQAEDVIEVKIAKFQFPVEGRSSQFDSLFQNI